MEGEKLGTAWRDPSFLLYCNTLVSLCVVCTDGSAMAEEEIRKIRKYGVLTLGELH